MGQHPTPDPEWYEDEDLEELGAPVYAGSGLSVRALTTEELQRFLDAHTGQPTRPLGSGWGVLDPAGHPAGVPGAAPEPAPALPAVGTGQADRRQPWPLGPGPVSAAPPPGAGRLDR
jgi:hypothetical protein